MLPCMCSVFTVLNANFLSNFGVRQSWGCSCFLDSVSTKQSKLNPENMNTFKTASH
jgi:hypothetical protein